MNDDITVRAAGSADAPGIARVLVDGWQTTYAGILPADFLASFTYDQHEAGTRQHLASLLASSAVFVAVTENEEIVGVAHVRESAESPGGCAAELDALYVLPSSQRRRVGSRLLATIVGWLTSRGRESMSLWVLRDNPYRQFYDRIGGIVLTEEKQDEIGGISVTSVAYGWRDLAALSTMLDVAAELPRSMILFHVSEQPDIAVLEPRQATATDAPLVWAIDDEHLRNYLVPRDCPRVTYSAGPRTTAADRDRFLGSSAAVLAIETGWLERARACRLYCYQLSGDTFELADACAGYFVSRVPVKPLGVQVIDDPLSAALRRDVELRVQPNLWALRDAVIASTLAFSIIRCGTRHRSLLRSPDSAGHSREPKPSEPPAPSEPLEPASFMLSSSLRPRGAAVPDPRPGRESERAMTTSSVLSTFNFSLRTWC